MVTCEKKIEVFAWGATVAFAFWLAETRAECRHAHFGGGVRQNNLFDRLFPFVSTWLYIAESF